MLECDRLRHVHPASSVPLAGRGRDGPSLDQARAVPSRRGAGRGGRAALFASARQPQSGQPTLPWHEAAVTVCSGLSVRRRTTRGASVGARPSRVGARGTTRNRRGPARQGGAVVGLDALRDEGPVELRRTALARRATPAAERRAPGISVALLIEIVPGQDRSCSGRVGGLPSSRDPSSTRRALGTSGLLVPSGSRSPACAHSASPT